MIRSIIFICVFLFSAPVWATDYYVRADGNDGNTGLANTSGAAWLTIQHCSDTAGAGDTCWVNDGTYAGWYVEDGGSSGSPKVFKAIHRGTVNITSGHSRNSGYDGITVESYADGAADYVTIDGFNVTGQTRFGVRIIAGSYIIVKNMKVYNNTGDCGLITGGTPYFTLLDSVFYGNGSTALEHNVYISNQESDNPVIRGNIIYNSGAGSGLQLNGDWTNDCPGDQSACDGYIDNATIEDNIIYGNAAKGISMISVRYSTVQNNVIYGQTSGAAGIHIVDQQSYHPSIDNIIVNNTIHEDNIYCIRINGDSSVTGNIVFNNILINSSGNYYIDEVGGNYFSNNFTATAVGSNFENAAVGEYHLAVGSSAINYGTTTYQSQSAPTDDYDDTTRSTPDAGAFEYINGDSFFYVRKQGSGSTCTLSAPCDTVTEGMNAMSGGDTVTVWDGTYNEYPNNLVPAGSSGNYSHIRAKNTAQVEIITTSTSENDHAIQISANYGIYEGLKFNGNEYSGEVVSISADYIKMLRCSAHGARNSDNGAGFTTQEGSSYVLFEECWAWGIGARYKFQVFHSDHVIVRRSVARHDYKTGGGTLHCAMFNNYDSSYTVFQNNIAIDSDQNDGVVCGVSNENMYGGFFFENKVDYSDRDVSMYGNMVINVSSNAAAGGVLDRASGTRIVDDMVIYDTTDGFTAMQGEDYTATFTVTNVTAGGINSGSGEYDCNNGDCAKGVGFEFSTNMTNTVQNSIFYGNSDYGIADYVTSNYNIFYNNTLGNTGGDLSVPSIGANSVTDHNPLTNGLLYLPRVESGSYLATACNSGPCGAQIMYKHGTDGTLWGESGYATLTSDELWPFPNQDLIKTDFASYDGAGPAGARGFAASGKQLNGTDDITLTSYIWEYLGNQMPSDIYGEAPATAPGLSGNGIGGVSFGNP